MDNNSIKVLENTTNNIKVGKLSLTGF